MTAMTSAAGASTVIDWVDWSAMGSRLAVPRCSASRPPGALLLTGSNCRLDLPGRPRPGPRATVPPDGRGGEDQACASSAFPRPPRWGPTRPSPTCSPRTSPRSATRPASASAATAQWQDVTWKEFGDQVAGVAKGLIASGVAAGDRVALQAKTRYEWAVIDFAIWTAGAVAVPIYETSSADQVAWILSDSGATAVIVERDEHAERRRVRARPGARPAVGPRHRRRRGRHADPGRQGRARQRARGPPRDAARPTAWPR